MLRVRDYVKPKYISHCVKVHKSEQEMTEVQDFFPVSNVSREKKK